MERASPAHQTSWRQTTSGGGGEGAAGAGAGAEEEEEEDGVEATDAEDHSISARPMPSTRSLRRLDAGKSRPQQLRVTTLIRLHDCCCC